MLGGGGILEARYTQNFGSRDEIGGEVAGSQERRESEVRIRNAIFPTTIQMVGERDSPRGTSAGKGEEEPKGVDESGTAAARGSLKLLTMAEDGYYRRKGKRTHRRKEEVGGLARCQVSRGFGKGFSIGRPNWRGAVAGSGRLTRPSRLTALPQLPGAQKVLPGRCPPDCPLSTVHCPLPTYGYCLGNWREGGDGSCPACCLTRRYGRG